jgi:hypothetical protein
MLERIVIETMYWGGILAFLFLVGWLNTVVFKLILKFGSKRVGKGGSK